MFDHVRIRVRILHNPRTWCAETSISVGSDRNLATRCDVQNVRAQLEADPWGVHGLEVRHCAPSTFSTLISNPRHEIGLSSIRFLR